MIRKIFFIVLLVTFTSSMLQAQDDERRQRLLKEQKGITYNTEMTGDLKLMTNGWSIAGSYGILKNYYTTTFYTVEFGELKHVREDRQRADYSLSAFGRSARSFVFGKQNSFYALRGGIGQKRYFSEKARRKGVAVGMSYSFGPSLGLLKPYYLEIARQEQGSNRINIYDVKYTEETASEFLEINRIYGSSSLAMGIDEISLVPGGFGKIALHLDWGAFDETVKALEAGIAFDLYFGEVPIMVTNDNRPYFINLYIAAQLGKRK